MAIPNTIDSAFLGESVTAFATFVVDSSISLGLLTASWEIQDENGAVYDSGVASGLTTAPYNNSLQTITAQATLTIPTTLPVTQVGTKYKLVWLLSNAKDNTIPSTYSEAFKVEQTGFTIAGVPDMVEVYPTNSVFMSVLPVATPAPTLTIYSGNIVFTSASVAGAPVTTANGYQYSYTLSGVGSVTNNIYSVNSNYAAYLVPSVEPYTVVWNYTDPSGNSITEDGYWYFINPMILQAAKELQAMVYRVPNTNRLLDLQIDINVLLWFLNLGSYAFNGTGMPTDFTFTAATGAIRSWWLKFSALELLRSQYMVEAERSFQLQGQSVTLDMDITQHYNQMASDINGDIQQWFGDFKKNLNRRGINAGPGTYPGPNSNYVGGIGIAITPVSNYYANYSRNYQRYRG